MEQTYKGHETIRRTEILIGTLVFFVATAASFLWLPVAMAAVGVGVLAVVAMWVIRRAWMWYDASYNRGRTADDFMAGRETEPHDPAYHDSERRSA